MRITLNLASRPFVELRPLYARLRVWMVLLAVLAVPLWFLMRSEQRKAAEANAQIQQLQANIQNLRRQHSGFEALMRQPQNAAVLSQSEYLNHLFERKAFSWTAIMMDLENVLPTGVQVMNIDPTTAPDGRVTIRLRVAGPRDHAVDLVRNLEHSRHFVGPRLADESAETNAGGGQEGVPQPVSASSNVNFDILAEYSPLLPEMTTTTESRTALPSVKTGVPPTGTAPKRHRSTGKTTHPAGNSARPRQTTGVAR